MKYVRYIEIQNFLLTIRYLLMLPDVTCQVDLLSFLIFDFLWRDSGRDLGLIAQHGTSEGKIMTLNSIRGSSCVGEEVVFLQLDGVYSTTIKYLSQVPLN